MKITKTHLAMFNARKHPSANDSVNDLTGYTRAVYFKLRDIQDRAKGICGKITMKDVKEYFN